LSEKEATSRHFDTESFQKYLETRLFGNGKRVVFLPTIDSTNTEAMRLARQGADEGTVVLTDSQTAGKGRLGRRWVDRSGYNVLSSTILRPQFPLYLLVMLASLAVVDAIVKTCGVVATVKWPNDVLIGNRKVAGILIETSHDLCGQLIAIMGIGVNVNGRITDFPSPESIPSQTAHSLTAIATTLEETCGWQVSRERFTAHLLWQLEKRYLALQQEASDPVAAAYGFTSRLIREQWRNHLSTLSRSVQIRQGDNIVSGVAEDVNDTGELLLRRHSGEIVTIAWGDIGYPTE
jgi:BirA family biotin operon repressor/biotin-[acetyl-CoA-carboxylase] ligase